jgi:hypothetical protein
VHETPNNSLTGAPVGFGVDWTFHEEPTFDSANVTVFPEESVLKPAAVQTPAGVHDTEERSLSVAPPGLGVVSIVHVVPSQCSANVDSTSDELVS